MERTESPPVNLQSSPALIHLHRKDEYADKNNLQNLGIYSACGLG